MTPSPPALPDDERAAVVIGTDQILDVRGLKCPLPVLKARKLLKSLPAGTTLEVQATDPASVIDFRHFCDTAPFDLIEWSERDGLFVFLIKKPA